MNGNLKGDGRICLNDGSEYFLGPNGSISNFGGSFEIDCPDVPEYPTVSDTTFTQSTVLADTLMLTGVTTLEPGVTVTVAENNLIIVADTLQMNGSGSSTSIFASSGELRLSEGMYANGGRLTTNSEGEIEINNDSFLQSTKINIESGGELITRSGVEIDTGESPVVINGKATFGSGLSLLNTTDVTVSSTAEVHFEGSAVVEFMAEPVYPPFLYTVPEFYSAGKTTASSTGTVTMRAASSSPAGWAGITLASSSANDSYLRNLQIEDAGIGVHLSSVSDVTLDDITIVSPTGTGVSASSSSFMADNIFITNPGQYGFAFVGGSPETGYFEVDANSSITGMRLQQSAVSNNTEGKLELSSGGTGIYLSNSDHQQLNGLIDLSSGSDVFAVNEAYAFFNGTSWGGSPNTWTDGTSTIIVNNPNNPLSAPEPSFEWMTAVDNSAVSRETTESTVIQQWAQRYRERPQLAVDWLSGQLGELSTEDYTQAVILLSDYYLSRGAYDQVLTLTESLRGEVVEPEAGALALRRLQLALFGLKDAQLAWSELAQLEAAEFDTYITDRFASMIRHHLGSEERPGTLTDSGTSAKGQTDLPMRFSLDQNYPNPFNPNTQIRYGLPESTNVRLEVYNIQGQRVATLANGHQNAGQHNATFDAANLASGLYIYRLTAGSFVETRKMMLVK